MVFVASSASQLAEFFAIIGLDPKSGKDTTDRLGNTQTIFSGRLLDAFPENFYGEPVLRELPLFCFPFGIKEQYEWKAPTFCTFIITDEYKNELYVSSMTAYCPINDPCTMDQLNIRRQKQEKATQRRASSSGPKAHGLTSLSLFSKRNNTTTTAHSSNNNSTCRDPIEISITQTNADKHNDTQDDLDQELEDINADAIIYHPVCFCLVSRIPCYDLFRQYLSHLYIEFIQDSGYQNPNNINSNNGQGHFTNSPSINPDFALALYDTHYDETPSTETPEGADAVRYSGRKSIVRAIPQLRRSLAHFLFDVPVPPPGRIEVRFQSANNSELSLSFPDVDDFPYCNVSLRTFFMCLDPNNVIRLLNLALLDSKIAFMSRRSALLNIATESLRTLLYPFYWEHVLIPILPSSLTDFLQAPLPFIVGLHPNLLEEAQEIEELFIVDLDNNRIITSNNFDEFDRIVSFPEKERSQLLRRLSALVKPELESSDALFGPPSSGQMPISMPHFDERAVRELFLGFFRTLIGNIESFEDDDNGFMQTEYLCSQSSERRPFLTAMVESQAFQQLRSRLRSNHQHSILYQELAQLCSDKVGDLDEICAEVLASKRQEHSKPNYIYSVLANSVALPESPNIAQSAMELFSPRTLKRTLSKKDISKEMLQILQADISKAMYSCNHEDEFLQMRMLFMRAKVFQRSKDYLKALQDLDCIKSIEPRLVPDNLLRDLLVKLSGDELEFVVNMSQNIRKLVAELKSPAAKRLRKYMTQEQDASVSNNNEQTEIDFNLDQLNEILEEGSGRFYLKDPFIKIMVDARIAPTHKHAEILFDTLAMTYGAYLMHYAPENTVKALPTGAPGVPGKVLSSFVKRLTKVVEVNKRFSQKLELDGADTVVATSALCTNSFGQLGRIHLTTKKILFGLTTYMEIAHYSEIVDVDKFEQVVPNRGVQRGFRINLRPSQHSNYAAAKIGSSMLTLMQAHQRDATNGASSKAPRLPAASVPTHTPAQSQDSPKGSASTQAPIPGRRPRSRSTLATLGGWLSFSDRGEALPPLEPSSPPLHLQENYFSSNTITHHSSAPALISDTTTSNGHGHGIPHNYGTGSTASSTDGEDASDITSTASTYSSDSSGSGSHLHHEFILLEDRNKFVDYIVELVHANLYKEQKLDSEGPLIDGDPLAEAAKLIMIHQCLALMNKQPKVALFQKRETELVDARKTVRTGRVNRSSLNHGSQRVSNSAVAAAAINFTGSPVALSIELLSRMINLYKKFVPMHKRFGTNHVKQLDELLTKMSATNEYIEYLALANELKRVDLSLLLPNYKSSSSSSSSSSSVQSVSSLSKEAFTFFANIYNAMCLHACIEKGFNLLAPMKRRLFFQTTSYQIAQYEVTMDDIEHCILRGDRPLGKHVAPLEKFIMHDPRCHFVFHICTLSSPPCRVLNASASFEDQINQAVEEYLLREISFDAPRKLLILPKLFDWYGNDFGHGDKAKLLDWIIDHLPCNSVLREDLEKACDSGSNGGGNVASPSNHHHHHQRQRFRGANAAKSAIKIKYREYAWDFCVRFV